jgi:hypothetical protein
MLGTEWRATDDAVPAEYHSIATQQFLSGPAAIAFERNSQLKPHSSREGVCCLFGQTPLGGAVDSYPLKQVHEGERRYECSIEVIWLY